MKVNLSLQQYNELTIFAFIKMATQKEKELNASQNEEEVKVF